MLERARREAEHPREQELRARAELERAKLEELERFRGGGVVPPVDVSTARRVDDNVRFTVYRPPAMAPQRWYPLLFFTHLGERRPDAPPDEPDPLALVDTTARGILGPAAASFPRIVQDAGAGIPHEALLRIVPSVPGLTFNPPEYSFLWTESVHKAEFTIRADAAFEGRTVRGSIDVRMGAISVAFITLAIPIDARTTGQQPPVPEVFHPYRRIFASYSHKDTAIVRQFANYARGIGDSYMLDVIDLRAGENWNERLLQLIDDADVFQLFWSSNSMGSPFVRREWEHALTVEKSNFVRPLYWESPLPERDGLPPPELKARHFASVAIADQPGSGELERRHREQKEEEARRREDERREAADPDQAMIGRQDQAVLTGPRFPPIQVEQPVLLDRSAPPPKGQAPASARLPRAVIVAVLALFLFMLPFALMVRSC